MQRLLLRRDFRYDGKVLEVGYPRNDVLQFLRRTQHPSVGQTARLGIGQGRTTALFSTAPTFRDYLSTDTTALPAWTSSTSSRMMVDLGDDYVLLMRGHAFNARASDATTSGSNVIDVTRYPDVADLYLAADVAVADYSSLRCDFASRASR